MSGHSLRESRVFVGARGGIISARDIAKKPELACTSSEEGFNKCIGMPYEPYRVKRSTELRSRARLPGYQGELTSQANG